MRRGREEEALRFAKKEGRRGEVEIHVHVGQEKWVVSLGRGSRERENWRQ